jgi:hypothetical protein
MNLRTRTNLTSKSRLARGLLAAGLLAGAAVIAIVPPARLPLPECVFHSITGYSCMTCGMTRSLHSAAHGQLAESARLHLFGPLVFFGLICCFLLFAAEAISGKNAALPMVRGRPIVAAAAIAWVAYWAARLVAEIA